MSAAIKNTLSIGHKINRWTILSSEKPSGYRKKWKCKCECGIVRVVLEQNLIGNRSRSCGCYSKDQVFTGFCGISGTYWTRLKADSNRRGRKLTFSIDIEYAWDLFIKQRSTCALTGWPIVFATTTKEYWAKNTTASLDRIDSSKGYDVDNVQWVHKDINKMKQNFKESRLLEMCAAIVDNNSIKDLVKNVE